jgi:hypothetical protein
LEDRDVTAAVSLRREEVNGQPGAMFLDREGRLIGVMSLDVAEGQIQSVSSIVNPDMLRHLGPLADLRALLRERRYRTCRRPSSYAVAGWDQLQRACQSDRPIDQRRHVA